MSRRAAVPKLVSLPPGSRSPEWLLESMRALLNGAETEEIVAIGKKYEERARDALRGAA